MSIMMTIKEAASAFRLSEYAVRQGIRQGKFPAHQLNGRRGKYLIDSQSFANALKDLCISNIKYNPDTNITETDPKIRRIQE